MKKVLRLSESELIGLVRKVINENNKHFYLRRSEIINNYVDEAISDINVGGFEPEDFEDYKSEVLWKTLGSLEYDNEREVDDVEEFFKYVKNKVINNKIKQGYLDYMKMNPMKKVIRLSESELVSLVKKMITEAKRLKNQDMIDAILDKISSQGIDSLDDIERYILDNPDIELVKVDATGDSDDSMSHELECLRSYIEFMFEPSDVKTDKDGNYVDHEGGDLYVWNNNETPEDTEDCFERFYGYLSELVNSGADRDCEGMSLDDVDAHIYEFFLDEIERQKHFGADFDELLQ